VIRDKKKYDIFIFQNFKKLDNISNIRQILVIAYDPLPDFPTSILSSILRSIFNNYDNRVCSNVPMFQLYKTTIDSHYLKREKPGGVTTPDPPNLPCELSEPLT